MHTTSYLSLEICRIRRSTTYQTRRAFHRDTGDTTRELTEKYAIICSLVVIIFGVVFGTKFRRTVQYFNIGDTGMATVYIRLRSSPMALKAQEGQPQADLTWPPSMATDGMKQETGKGNRNGPRRGTRRRQHKKQNKQSCTLNFEDFPVNTPVPNALLNDDWKCRRCRRLVASHEKRAHSAFGKFVETIPDGVALQLLFPVLFERVGRNLNGWDRIRSHRTVSDSTEIRAPVQTYYDLTEKHCQILGPTTPHVVNAHIWPHHNGRNLDFMGLKESDIDSPRNILRLHKDIEHHFDHMGIMFEEGGGTDRPLLLKVLNPDLLDEQLLDLDTTFRDIDGLPLQFPSGSRPWHRLIGMQSSFALKYARGQGWLDEGQFTAAEERASHLLEFSLDDEACARLKLWMDTDGRVV